jgi:NAD(P)-dependent dehydrogenase (short-subunit alcohol dehydrogenase family)
VQLATDYLGYFALANHLHDPLSAAPSARIVSVSSSAYFYSPIVFEDIHFERRPYDPWAAYGQSKTANILFAVAAITRWADDGITANALIPGGTRTRLQRHVPPEEMDRLTSGTQWKTPEQGATTSIFLATSLLLDGVGGRYFVDCERVRSAIEAQTP